MVVQYRYKDQLFDDIRDIFKNNKLRPNFDFIYEEYIPYQLSLSGGTFFEGVTLAPSKKYDPMAGHVPNFKSHEEIFNEGISNYMKDIKAPYALTLSGGIDSGILAFETSPKKSFSDHMGLTNQWEVDMLHRIISLTNMDHTVYTVSEEDYITCIDEVFEACGFPMGGFGTPSDFACMKKFVKENPDIKTIIMGYGGDEIFMGYLWNFLCFRLRIDDNIGDLLKEEFTGFSKSCSDVMSTLSDNIILASLYRGDKKDCFDNWAIRDLFRKELVNITDVLSKVLYVNLNILEPSFLHNIQQQGKFYGVDVINPLINDTFIDYAYELNTPIPQKPKEVLMKLCPVYTDYRKTGNPVPTDKWLELNSMFKDLWKWLDKREIFGILGEYPGLNRYSWGIGMVEIWLRRFYD